MPEHVDATCTVLTISDGSWISVQEFVIWQDRGGSTGGVREGRPGVLQYRGLPGPDALPAGAPHARWGRLAGASSKKE